MVLFTFVCIALNARDYWQVVQKIKGGAHPSFRCVTIRDCRHRLTLHHDLFNWWHSLSWRYHHFNKYNRRTINDWNSQVRSPRARLFRGSAETQLCIQRESVKKANPSRVPPSTAASVHVPRMWLWSIGRATSLQTHKGWAEAQRRSPGAWRKEPAQAGCSRSDTSFVPLSPLSFYSIINDPAASDKPTSVSRFFCSELSKSNNNFNSLRNNFLWFFSLTFVFKSWP